MDTSIVPANTSWTLMVDSGARLVESQSWDDSTHLRLESDAGSQPAIDVTIELNTEHPLLHALAGRTVLPFGPEIVPAG